MSGRYNLQKTAKQLNTKKANRRILVPASLGLPPTKVVEVSGRGGYHYARIRGNLNEVVQVYNPITNPIYDWPVLITFRNNRWEVEETNTGRYPTWDENVNVPKHGKTHILWAYDPVYITTQQIVDELVYGSATGTIVHINQGLIQYQGSFALIENQDLDLASYAPTGTGAIWAIVRANSLGTLSVQNNMTYVENITQLNYSNIPSVNENYIGLAAVKLWYGQTGIDRRPYTSDIIDLRYRPNYVGSSTGSNAVCATFAFVADNQAFPHSTGVAINYSNLVIDTNGFVTTGAEWKFQPNVSGYYVMSAHIRLQAATVWTYGERGFLFAYKNGADLYHIDRKDNYPNSLVFMELMGVSPPISLNGSTDYLTAYLNQNSGGTLTGTAGYIGIWKI